MMRTGGQYGDQREHRRGAALAACALLCLGYAVTADGQARQPVQAARPMAAQSRQAANPPRSGGANASIGQAGASAQQAPAPRSSQNPANGALPPVRGEHLQQWIEHHNQLSIDQQRSALQNEPGFRSLPPQTQQRMLDRLQNLNSLPPQQRERVLQRGEAMEKLSPEQRAQVRSAMGQLGALSVERRRAVGRSFRELRNLSPQQQNRMLNSQEFRDQFSDQERGTLGNLLSVSPMLPQQ